MRVSKVSSHPVLAPAPVETAEEKPTANQDSGLQDFAFFAAQVRGVGPLPIGAAQLKAKLRSKIEESLNHIFQVPQLVDSLTDYLAEVVHEDPHGGELFGVVD